ncbi:TPA: glycosyltransferase family 8 protein, partial [Streptococcus pneumoniae]|nr:glycosyltransferase family 8 protein [Streptococcus pneumoniae]
WLLDDATVYLDINHGAEVLDVLSKARDRGVKIFTFDNTRKSSEDSLYDGIFSVERPDDLVDRMKNIEIE